MLTGGMTYRQNRPGAENLNKAQTAINEFFIPVWYILCLVESYVALGPFANLNISAMYFPMVIEIRLKVILIVLRNKQFLIGNFQCQIS